MIRRQEVEEIASEIGASLAQAARAARAAGVAEDKTEQHIEGMLKETRELLQCVIGPDQALELIDRCRAIYRGT